MGRLVRPGRYYDFTRYRPKTSLRRGKREYSIPSTTVKVAVRETGPDLVTVHLLEPHSYGEDFTDSVIEMLDLMGVKRYSLIGAMYDMVPHTRPLLVSGGSVDPSNEAEYRTVEVRPSDYEGPSTIAHLIFEHAESVGMDTRIFVVHPAPVFPGGGRFLRRRAANGYPLSHLWPALQAGGPRTRRRAVRFSAGHRGRHIGGLAAAVPA